MTTTSRIKVVLALSLAFNLLFAGAVLGRWQVGDRPPPPLMWSLRNLPEDIKAKAQKTMTPQRAHQREHRMQMQAASAEVRRAALTEPFNQTALNEALTELRRVQEKFMIQTHEAATELLSQLSVEERRMVLESLLRPPRRPDHTNPPNRPHRPDQLNPPTQPNPPERSD